MNLLQTSWNVDGWQQWQTQDVANNVLDVAARFW